MPIRDLISLTDPRREIYYHAFSTEFKIFPADRLMSIQKGFRHCTNSTVGAIYDRYGWLVKLSERGGGRNSDLVVGLDPPRIFDHERRDIANHLQGRSLYLGYFMNHYGHFLVETMSRFWSLGYEDFDHYVFFPFTFHDGQILISDFHKVVFQKFGIPSEKTVFLRDTVLFDEIVIPERLMTINASANIHMSTIYHRLARSYRRDGGASRIFLSRLEPYARVANIPQVEEVFRDLGFEIIYPELLGLEEQLAYYANCRVMAGFAGSGLHNCLFCQTGTYLIEVGDIRSQDRPLSTQRVVNQVACTEERYIPYRGSPDGRIDTTYLQRMLLDMPLLAAGSDVNATHEFASRSSTNHYVWPATMTVHIARAGDVTRIGRLEIQGLDEGCSIEGLSIALHPDAPFGIEYKVLQNDRTWTDWSDAGTFLGSRGQSKPIRGYAVRLKDCRLHGFRAVCLGRFAGHAGIIDGGKGGECRTDDGAVLTAMQIRLQPV